MKLKLVRIRTFYWVEAWQEWMRAPLTAKLRNSYDSVEYTKDCFYPQSDGSVLFLAGLIEEFEKAANRAGYDLEIIEGRDPNPNDLEPHFDEMHADLRYKQADVINAFVTNDKGLITCTTGFGKGFCLKQLCAIYPQAKIVITTARRLVVDQLYENISQLLGKNEVGKCYGGTPSTEDEKRVTVVSMASLERAALDTCDIFVVDEVHNVGDNKAFKTIVERAGNCKMFGLSASPKRGDGGLTLIKALFGKVIATCSYQEAADNGMVTPIKAVMPTYPHRPITRMTDFPIINKRIHYWQNWQRNAFIASVTLDIPADAQTVISVTTLEHALFLKARPELKDWPILHSGKVDTGKVQVPFNLDTAPSEAFLATDKKANDRLDRYVVFPGDDTHFPGFVGKFGDYFTFAQAMDRLVFVETGKPVCDEEDKVKSIAGFDPKDFSLNKRQYNQMASAIKSGEIKRAIATTVIKEGVDMNHLRFLIRADGESSGIFNTQVSGRLSRKLDGKDYAILLDPYDDDNPWVKGRSEARRKLYINNGWMVK